MNGPNRPPDSQSKFQRQPERHESTDLDRKPAGRDTQSTTADRGLGFSQHLLATQDRVAEWGMGVHQWAKELTDWGDGIGAWGDAVASEINTLNNFLDNCKIVQGELVQNKNLSALGYTTISHSLGRVPNGYCISRVRTNQDHTVKVMKLKDDSNMGGSPPGGPTTCDAYVVNNWGGGYTDGDIVEYNGSSWVVIVSGSGGFPPNGTKAVVHPSPAGSFAANALDIARYITGTGWVFTTKSNALSALVDENNSIEKGRIFVYDSLNGAWDEKGRAIYEVSLTSTQLRVFSYLPLTVDLWIF